MRKNIILLAAGAVLLSSSVAFALTATDAFQATVTISSNCIIVADDLNFGTLGVITGIQTSLLHVLMARLTTCPFQAWLAV